ncbi:synaptonemal complex central element protein 3 [Struthio camelus]
MRCARKPGQEPGLLRGWINKRGWIPRWEEREDCGSQSRGCGVAGHGLARAVPSVSWREGASLFLSPGRNVTPRRPRFPGQTPPAPSPPLNGVFSPFPFLGRLTPRRSDHFGVKHKINRMAKSEPQERNYDNMVKMVEDLNRDLEKLLEEMEKLSVQATWMAYDMVVMRTNPDLANSMRRLEDAFLNCKEEMEKKWQEVLKESRGEEQKNE